MDDVTRKSKLQEIFDSDSLGLLDVKDKSKQERRDEDWRLIEQFGEITQFYEDNQRLPNGDGGDIAEYTLAARLSGIKSDPKKVKILREYDMYNLLQSEAVSYTHLRAHETRHDLVCRLLLEKKK